MGARKHLTEVIKYDMLLYVKQERGKMKVKQTFSLDEALVKELKIEAIKKDKDFSELAEEFIRKGLEEKKEK